MFSVNIKYLTTMLTLALGLGVLASYGAQSSIKGQETLIFYAIHICLAAVVIVIGTYRRKKLNTSSALGKKEIQGGIYEWITTTVTATVIASYCLFSRYDFTLKTILILITSISLVSLACALHLRNDLYRRVASSGNQENN